jgi:hypothetical protein
LILPKKYAMFMTVKILPMFYNDGYNYGKRKKNLTKIENISTF